MAGEVLLTPSVIRVKKKKGLLPGLFPVDTVYYKVYTQKTWCVLQNLVSSPKPSFFTKTPFIPWFNLDYSCPSNFIRNLSTAQLFDNIRGGGGYN